MKEFTLAELASLGRGTVAAEFQRVLSIVTDDIVENPGEKKARKIIVTLEMKPGSSDDLNRAEELIANVGISSKMPGRHPAGAIMQIRKKRNKRTGLDQLQLVFDDAMPPPDDQSNAGSSDEGKKTD